MKILSNWFHPQTKPVRPPPPEPITPAPKPVTPAKKKRAANDFWEWVKREYKFTAAVDIGAFAGEYVRIFDQTFQIPIIYAIEPQPDRAVALRDLPLTNAKLEVYDYALWNEPGEMTLRLNSNPSSSSLLPCHELQTQSFPIVQEIGEIQVKTARLDDLIPHHQLAGDVIIKIDAQGAEDKIIEGGLQTFSKANCVMIEMSYVPMYVGQPLFHEIHMQLTDLGFKFIGIKNQVLSPLNERPLFAQCLYVR